VERRRRSSRRFGFAPARPARRDLTVASSTIFGWFAAPSGRGRGGGEEPERVIWAGGDRPLLSLSLFLSPYSFSFFWKLERERIILLYSLRKKKHNSNLHTSKMYTKLSRKAQNLIGKADYQATDWGLQDCSRAMAFQVSKKEEAHC